MKYFSGSEQETSALGEKLAAKLEPNSVVALTGDLGAGKTAFVRGVCRYFHADGVHSPTFSLVNEYEGDLMIYHFDAYRIDSDGWYDMGFDEYLDAGGICLVEWSEQVELPECIRVHIDGSGEMVRTVSIEGAEL